MSCAIPPATASASQASTARSCPRSGWCATIGSPSTWRRWAERAPFGTQRESRGPSPRGFSGLRCLAGDWLTLYYCSQCFEQLAGAVLARGGGVVSVEESAVPGVGQARAASLGFELDGRQRHRDPRVAHVHVVGGDDALIGHDVLVERFERIAWSV